MTNQLPSNRVCYVIIWGVTPHFVEKIEKRWNFAQANPQTVPVLI